MVVRSPCTCTSVITVKSMSRASPNRKSAINPSSLIDFSVTFGRRINHSKNDKQACCVRRQNPIRLSSIYSPCVLENSLAMSQFWETLTGRRSSNAGSQSTGSPAPNTTFTASPSSSSSSTSSSPFALSPPEATDVSSFLSGTALPDPSQLHPLANLDSSTLDYLSLDESALSDLPGSRSALPSRGWSDDLQYGTGITYLTALTMGGAWGMIEGLQKSPVGSPPKLRLNSVLNSMTRRGPFLGNSAGVLAMVYNGVNSTIGYYRGKHDAGNSLVAGALSGMLFKSTRGVRSMAISGGLVAGMAGLWAVSCSLPGPPLGAN